LRLPKNGRRRQRVRAGRFGGDANIEGGPADRDRRQSSVHRPIHSAEFLRNPYNHYVVNIRSSYFQETEAWIERLTKDLGISKIAILYQDDAFGLAGLEGVKLASTIKDNFKRSTDLTARYGGEEFVVVLSETRNRAVARSLGSPPRDPNRRLGTSTAPAVMTAPVE
jgi:Diguanylate cyclase, GGDEF domain